jgi:hypothetical protein
LEDSKGKAVKMISELLRYLPEGYFYKVIFMNRKMKEILASQKQMLIRRGKPENTISSEKMAKLFKQHLRDIKTWLETQSNMEVIYVNYNEIIEKKREEELERINLFLGKRLCVKKMIRVIDKRLYRQRK